MSGVRLWASGTDFIDLRACVPVATWNNPVALLATRGGLIRRQVQPGAVRRIVSVTLPVRFNDTLALNDDGASTRRTLQDWLEHYVCESLSSSLALFIEYSAHDQEGNDYLKQRYLLGSIENMPGHFGLRGASLNGSTPKLHALEFTVRAMGTFDDFDSLSSVDSETVDDYFAVEEEE